MKLRSVLKNLPSGWTDEADAMGEDQLRDIIVESENNIRVTKSEMEQNQGFQDAKTAYKEVAAPFRDALKAQQAKIQYALHLLEQKGKI